MENKTFVIRYNILIGKQIYKCIEEVDIKGLSVMVSEEKVIVRKDLISG